MEIDIRGIRINPTLRARIGKRMTAALAPIRIRPVTAQVTFFDENGPKGGIAIRCALTVRLPYRPTLRVEHMDETPRLAFDRGFATLERRLERYSERARENQRHPKKYFVAKRLEGLSPRRRARVSGRPEGGRKRKGVPR